MNHILEEVCDRLKEDESLLGIILYGSIADNKSHPHSDIDLIAVYDKDIDSVKGFVLKGQGVQILRRSYEIFKTKLFKQIRNRPYSLSAKVLYDKTGKLEELIQVAKDNSLLLGPKKLSEDEVLTRRISLSQDIYTIEGFIETDRFEGASLLMDELLLTALELYYDYNKWFMVRPKHLIDDLKLRDGELAEKASLVILSTDIKARLANLWMIRDYVLEIFGGEKLDYEMNF